MFDTNSGQLSLQLIVESIESCIVRESARARRLSVRVFRNGKVEVIKPRRASRSAVVRFLEEHRAWIEEKRSEALRNAVPAQPFPPVRVELPAFGETWRVHLAGGGGRPRIRAHANCVLEVRGEAALAREALRKWLLARASEVLITSLARLAVELGFNYRKVVIRRQRSRWGSCSARGTISLNCCLLFQRPEVVRYLMIHELAHTRHMNHSKRFWDCVAKYCPQFRKLDAELLSGWRRVPSWVFDRPSM